MNARQQRAASSACGYDRSGIQIYGRKHAADIHYSIRSHLLNSQLVMLRAALVTA